MKSLSAEEMECLTLEKAWVIVGDYTNFLEKINLSSITIFDDELPWDRRSIQLALFIILEEAFTRRDRKTFTLAWQVESRLMDYIPNPDSYQNLLRLRENFIRAMDNSGVIESVSGATID